MWKTNMGRADTLEMLEALYSDKHLKPFKPLPVLKKSLWRCPKNISEDTTENTPYMIFFLWRIKGVKNC